MAKIMVVDDAPADLQNLKNILTKGGHQVIEVTSGQDSIAKAKAEKPDAIVMDVVMPGVNGFQATRQISKDPDTSAIPIIVVSAKNQETDRLWAMRQGAREYVVKPVKDADLLAKVKQVLGG
ncbi:MAG: response regulator [Nevskiaceae bacterium]|jgi:twitching motility two-component system response regulator PilH